MKRDILIFSVGALILDQASKIVIDLTLNLNETINIIKNFFNITLIHNYGAALGMLNSRNTLLIIITIIALGIILRFLNTFKVNNRNVLAFGMLIGGISGNLLDRLFLGYVRDFLDFKLLGYNMPVFNIGDVFIFISTIMLIYAIIKGEDNANNNS